MRSKIELKYGCLCAQVISQYNSMAEIVGMALGGSPSKAPTMGHANIEGGVDKAVANLNGLLNFG